MSNPLSRAEFVLSTDGKIIKRTITETEKELTAEALNSLTKQQVVHWPRLFIHPDIGAINAGISKNTMTLTAQLGKIRIKTNYTAREGIVSPASDRKYEPVFDLSWTPPADLKLFFVVELDTRNNFIAAHLPAIGEEKRCYRLPLGNLYETGGICLGKEFGSADSALSLFHEAFDQFDKSQWNDDLQNSEDIINVRKIFRFQAVNAGFEQLEAAVPWQQICQVIDPPILNFIKL